ncbi:hypothetical protein AeMF1_006404 [Aphanomyces euteiches]|nr:hypothetical protein AeMF1_006404 [Aphanomyces euteiches]KAH9184027.1 hypothetical protein AeNC1_013996 [Aphanomyces euteiches]
MQANQAEIDKRRQRGRFNQRTYRIRKKSSEKQLKCDVFELSRGNDRLETHKLVLQRGLWCHAEHQSVVEYYQLFRDGYSESDRQYTFLRFFLHPNVQLNAHLLFAPCSLVLTIYYLVDFHIADVSSSSDEVVVQAQVMTTFHFGKRAIETFFPQAIERSDLMAKLMGWHLKLPLRAMFTFDDSKTVTRVTVETDLIPELIRHLGDIGAALAVLPSEGHHPDIVLFPPLDPNAT